MDEIESKRSEIRELRDRMGDRLDDIADRLNPHHVTEQIKDSVRDATVGRAQRMARNEHDSVSDAGHSIWDTIRDNPVPAAMAAVGLGWLFMNGRNGSSSGSGRLRGGDSGTRSRPDSLRGEYRPRGAWAADSEYGYYDFDTSGHDSLRYERDTVEGRMGGSGRMQGADMGERARGMAGHMGERAQEFGSQVTDRAQEIGSQVTDRAQEIGSQVTDRAREIAGTVSERTQQMTGQAREMADQAQERIGEWADTAQHQARRVEERLGQALDSNPLAAGAAALALGLAVGLSVPETRQENQLFGATRDRLVDRAQDMVEDTREKAQRVAGRVMEETKETVRDAAQEEGLTS